MSMGIILVWIMRQSLAALLSFLFLLWMLCMCDGALMEASLLPSCLRGISKAKIQCGLLLHTAKNGMFPAGLKSVNTPEQFYFHSETRVFMEEIHAHPLKAAAFTDAAGMVKGQTVIPFAPMMVSAKPFLI